MAKLGIWKVDRHDPVHGTAPGKPLHLKRSQIGLEKSLEDWIANDVSLIGEGLTIVGRQIVIDEGRLDLLAVDAQEHWVVIEVKPGTLDAAALTQALGYAASIDRLDAEELRATIVPRLGEFGDAETLSQIVDEQLRSEGEARPVAVLLVGAGIHPGLERTKEFLGRYRVRIKIVSFEVFELDGGPQLLVREVVKEPTPREPQAEQRKLTVEAIRKRAAAEGVAEQFDRFVKMSKDAGLAVQSQRASVRIAPPANRTRFLMYASPDSGGLRVYTGPREFAEFYPKEITDDEAAEALGPDSPGGLLRGAELSARLDRIERFLIEKFPAEMVSSRTADKTMNI